MQYFFHWDVPLPAPKKLKITEIDLNNQTPEQVPKIPRDIHVIEEQDKANTTSTHPHQW